mmetsp:Transcript_42521/g.66618  ORF Transcript_42521/g.66618 Transcript_42521/m.66618 type:complete len:129 (+) Transcript_42521:56-442(+)
MGDWQNRSRNDQNSIPSSSSAIDPGSKEGHLVRPELPVPLASRWHPADGFEAAGPMSGPVRLGGIQKAGEMYHGELVAGLLNAVVRSSLSLRAEGLNPGQGRTEERMGQTLDRHRQFAPFEQTWAPSS